MVIVDINRDACQGVRPLPRDKPEGLSLDNHGVPEIRDEADSGVDERSIRTAAATCSDRAITIFGTAADTTIEGGHRS